VPKLRHEDAFEEKKGKSENGGGLFGGLRVSFPKEENWLGSKDYQFIVESLDKKRFSYVVETKK